MFGLALDVRGTVSPLAPDMMQLELDVRTVQVSGPPLLDSESFIQFVDRFGTFLYVSLWSRLL